MKKDERVVAMVERLRELGAADRGERIRDSLQRWIENPLKPKTKEGNLRVNPILLLLAALVVLTASTFLFFSLVQP
jgi:hypothetical protein